MKDYSSAALRRRRHQLMRTLPPIEQVIRGSLIETYKRCGRPRDGWASQSAQAEIVGGDITSRGYIWNHHMNGDVTYGYVEGTAKVTPKGPGAFETVAQGKFKLTGGTGKHDIKGSGAYNCTFTQSGGGCDWRGETE